MFHSSEEVPAAAPRVPQDDDEAKDKDKQGQERSCEQGAT